MTSIAPSADVRICDKREESHPCDVQKPCDPYEEDDGDCLKPYICLERIKNPAFPGEITKCKSGNHMNVKTCAKTEPIHPCDPLPSCCAMATKKKKRPCNDPPLCLHRIKNPDMTKGLSEPCEPEK